MAKKQERSPGEQRADEVAEGAVLDRLTADLMQVLEERCGAYCCDFEHDRQQVARIVAARLVGKGWVDLEAP